LYRWRSEHVTSPPKADAGTAPSAARERLAKLEQEVARGRGTNSLREAHEVLGELADLVSALGGESVVGKTAWPADLNDEPDGATEWGADPEEVAHG
jgi:hypothetical protein